MSIDKRLLKTLSEKQVTDGPGGALPRPTQGWDVGSIDAQGVPVMFPTKINNLTTEHQLYSPLSDSPPGTSTSNASSWEKPDGLSSVNPAIPQRLSGKEHLEQKPGESLKKKQEEIMNSYLKGLKHDSEKPPLAYIPKAALYAEGDAFAFGAKKYDSWNYKHGIKVSRTLSAAIRHIMQFLDGEDHDQESGAHHLGCSRANLAMALDTLANHPEMDDRFKEKK